MINYGKQSISDNDIKRVIKTLKSDFLTQGPMVDRFEDSFAVTTKSKYAITFNSATSALHASCLAIGVGAEDVVWTSSISFVASANCAVYCGAKVDFVDIDLATYNIDPKALEIKLEQAKKDSCLPKILIVVHMCGNPCDMIEISRLSKIYGFKIIEDASHAAGASYSGNPIGSCEHSDIAVFSFHPVKIVTSGEGGIATTNCAKLKEKLRLFRSHGVTRNSNLFHCEEHSEQPWYYEQQSLGYNYRLSDIHSALGFSQLKELDSFVRKRNKLAEKYDNRLREFSRINLQKVSERSTSSYHLYSIRIDFDGVREKIELFKNFRSNAINLNVHYIPIHTQPFFRNMGFNEGELPISEAYYQQAVTLPLYPDLIEDDIDRISDLLLEFLS